MEYIIIINRWIFSSFLGICINIHINIHLLSNGCCCYCYHCVWRGVASSTAEDEWVRDVKDEWSTAGKCFCATFYIRSMYLVIIIIIIIILTNNISILPTHFKDIWGAYAWVGGSCTISTMIIDTVFIHVNFSRLVLRVPYSQLNIHILWLLSPIPFIILPIFHITCTQQSLTFWKNTFCITIMKNCKEIAEIIWKETAVSVFSSWLRLIYYSRVMN